jgi:hypothetical protein
MGWGFLGERMTGVPAHCPHCGRIFISSLIGFGPGTTLTLNNVGVSCPFCRQMANAVDGTFDFVGNLVRVQKRSSPLNCHTSGSTIRIGRCPEGRTRRYGPRQDQGRFPRTGHGNSQGYCFQRKAVASRAAVIVGRKLFDDDEHVSKLESAN